MVESPKNKAKQPKLTAKQAKFVQALAEGKNQTQAAIEAYPDQSYPTAAVTAVENLNKPNIKQAVEIAIGHHKITANEAVAPVRMALDYKGDTPRETTEMRLKGLYAYLKLAQFIDGDNPKGGNTINFNFGTKNYMNNNDK